MIENMGFEDEIVMKGFIKIIRNPDYMSSKWKRYRILYFSYIVGCVGPDDLSFLFRKSSMLNESVIISYRNSNRAMLNSLSKTSKESKAKLKKIENGYYVITPEGVEHLVEHLIEESVLSHTLKEYFLNHVNYRYINCEHACMSGRSLLSYLSCDDSETYIWEPAFTENMKLMFGEARKKMSVYLIPDAVVIDSKKEIFFIEADSGKERLTSKLLPKIQRYVSAACGLMDRDEYNLTLHFYLWSDIRYKGGEVLDLDSVNQVCSLYDFIVNYLKCNITIQELFESIGAYSQEEGFKWNSLQMILNLIETDGMDSVEKFKEKCLKKIICEGEVVGVKSRRKLLSSLPDLIPQFKKYLYKGMRFFITSSNTTKLSMICTYFDKDIQVKIISYILGNEFNVHAVRSYNTIGKYTDEKTGETYYFRNVFEYKIGEKEIDVVIENISDDIGGKIRIERWAKNAKYIDGKDVIFLLVYNDCYEDVIEEYACAWKTIKSKSLIPYSRYVTLTEKIKNTVL